MPRSNNLSGSLYPDKGASHCEAFKYVQSRLPRTESQPHNDSICVHPCQPKSVSKYHLPSAVRGHSFLPCDRQFAVIERMKRKKDTAEMYTDCHAMIDSKYVTVEVTGHMIHDYKGHFDTLFKKTVTKDKVKFKITEYKRFRFTNGDKLHVYASKSMSGLVETAFSIVKPNVVPTFPTAPYYTSMVPVKKAKLDKIR